MSLEVSYSIRAKTDITSWSRQLVLFVICVALCSPLQLAGAALPPKLQKRTDKVEVLKSQRFQELCTVIEGDIPINSRWLKNGQTMSSNTHEAIIRRIDDFSSSLVIESVTEYSSGNYSCVVSNPAGMDSYTVTLQVNGVLPENLEDLRTDSRVRVSAEGTLSIQRSDEKDEGFYLCHASNGIGEGLKKTVKVDVLVSPRVSESFLALTQRKGTPVEIVCNITGDMPLQVTWKKDNSLLNNNDRVSVTQTDHGHSVVSTLSLSSADSSDNALYLCSVKNHHGRSEMRARLTVVEVPGIPESVGLIRAWSRSIRIRWELPYTGNSPLSKIIVEYQKDKDDRAKVRRKVFRATDTSAILEGLRPWTRYKVWMSAENAVGTGRQTEAMVFTTREEEPASAPSNFRIESIRATTTRVSWQHLRHQDWNGQILGYYVGYKGFDEGSPFALRTVAMNGTGPGQAYVLTGLQKMSSYKVVVSAFNSAGSGPPSEPPLTFQTKSGSPPSTPKLKLLSKKSSICEVQIYPESSEDEIEEYLLHLKRQHRTWEEMPLTSSKSVHWVGGLVGDSQYQMFVTARNPFGTSEPSQVVTFITSRPTFEELEGEPLWAKMSVVLPVAASAMLVVVVCCVACCLARRLSRPPKQEGVAANDFSYTRAGTSRSESASFYARPTGGVSMQNRPPASLPRSVRALQYSEPRNRSPIEEPKYECVLEEMKTFIGSTGRPPGP